MIRNAFISCHKLLGRCVHARSRFVFLTEHQHENILREHTRAHTHAHRTCTVKLIIYSKYFKVLIKSGSIHLYCHNKFAIKWESTQNDFRFALKWANYKECFLPHSAHIFAVLKCAATGNVYVSFNARSHTGSHHYSLHLHVKLIHSFRHMLYAVPVLPHPFLGLFG